MEELIDSLLSLARVGESISETEPVTLESVVHRGWSNVPACNARIHTVTSATIKADRDRLQELFENLFRNAIEHGGDDVTMTVGDLETGFFVEDDGPGIHPGHREDVFESGFTTRENGTGFGLSIVRKIANAHSWEVKVIDGQDGGARFEITGVEFC